MRALSETGCRTPTHWDRRAARICAAVAIDRFGWYLVPQSPQPLRLEPLEAEELTKSCGDPDRVEEITQITLRDEQKLPNSDDHPRQVFAAGVLLRRIVEEAIRRTSIDDEALQFAHDLSDREDAHG